MINKLRKCEQRRHDCFACNETGHCEILKDTHFERFGKTYKCPFYKTRAEVGGDLSQYEVNENEDSAS